MLGPGPSDEGGLGGFIGKELDLTQDYGFVERCLTTRLKA